jgi:proteasome assembly chaperone (PAC2) family protein
MTDQSIQIESIPDLKNPILIAGFAGWGNAMDISTGTVQYLVKHLQGKAFASFKADPFYRYDESRPVVLIDNGLLKHFYGPGGSFYYVRLEDAPGDLVLVEAIEPHLRWDQFVDAMLSLAQRLGVHTIITIGSMYDQVLHSDRIVSGIASSAPLLRRLEKEGVHPISYHGPSTIHSLIHAEGERRKQQSMSLWAHCPYYVQGAKHYGILARMTAILAAIGDFHLDTTGLEDSWEKLDRQIRELIANDPKLEALVAKLRKSKARGGIWPVGQPEDSRSDGGKVIDLRDFFDPKT